MDYNQPPPDYEKPFISYTINQNTIPSYKTGQIVFKSEVVLEVE